MFLRNWMRKSMNLGDIGDIFKKLGIDPSNLGGLAESVLKTIGLAGNAI